MIVAAVKPLRHTNNVPHVQLASGLKEDHVDDSIRESQGGTQAV